MSADNPRNLILAFTPNGASVHTDAPGINQLLAHSVNADGQVDSHWFVAEPTKYKVGRAQLVDRDEGVGSKKARSVSIGLRGMGPRNNCFVVVSIPLKQKMQEYQSLGGGDSSDSNGSGPVYRSMGVASAARMSVDEESAGKVAANEIDCERPDGQPIMVTLQLFNVLQGGAGGKVSFAAEDLAAMVADMEEVYDTCDARCDISQLPVMLKKFSKADMEVIKEKLAKDPPKSNPFMPCANAMHTVLSS